MTYTTTGPIRTDFLVYGECVCGWSCACHEGAVWPKCPKCGERVHPPRGCRENRDKRYGYIAELYPEQEAYLHPRVDVSMAYRNADEDDQALVLTSTPMAYRMYDRAELQALQGQQQHRWQAQAIEAWHRRRLWPNQWRHLPWRYRIRPTTPVAILVGKCSHYATLTTAEFAQFAQGTLQRPRRKRLANWLYRKLERPPPGWSSYGRRCSSVLERARLTTCGPWSIWVVQCG